MLGERYKVNWQLEAKTGATTRTTLGTLAQLWAGPFDVAVISLGVNDVSRGVFMKKWLRQQAHLIDLLTTQFGVTKVLVSGLPPMGHFPLLPNPLRWVLGRQAQRFDRVLAAMIAARPSCEYVQLDLPLAPEYAAEDGFHPSPTAYALWAKMLAERL